MDKREAGKTITIKINGKQQAFDEPKQKPAKRQGQIIDKSVMVSTEDAQPKKEMIDNKETQESITINETTIADEQGGEQFDWILPEPSPVEYDLKEDAPPLAYEKKPSNHKSAKKWPVGKSKLNRGVFATIFFAVFLAVILGTSFGFTMLKLVFIERPEESDVVLNATTIPKTNQAEVKPSGNLTVALPTITTWVIQEGAYSNKDSAKQVVSSLKEKGNPAMLFEDTERMFILLGVADTKAHAKEYGTGLSGIDEPFAKEISTGGKKISGVNEQEKVFLEGLPSIFNNMTLAASTGVVSENAISSVNASTKELGDGNEIKQDQIKTLKEQTDEAIQTLTSLKKSADKKDRLALQQDLLAIFASYHMLK
ncbi:hypothetical protein [Bacillus sp. T3]|uniref:SPOR domain-containing protein n=1 Tax=Bacillus sp. T3 TaxID=467262 RepID=UPI00298132AB|nr:hypothetical protein [Bacillus sp. T3]